MNEWFHQRQSLLMFRFPNAMKHTTSTKQRPLLEWKQLPMWMKDNKYIHSGYRNPNENWSNVFWDLFRLHNQTGNIYSHFIGFILALLLSVSAIRNADSLQDAWAWVPLTIGSVSVCLCSCIYHTIASHSRTVLIRWIKMDYIGIVAQMCGGFITCISFLFKCYGPIKYCYMVFNGAVGLWVIKQLLADDFAEHHKHTMRTVVFAALFCTMLIPLLHSALSTECSNCDAKRDVLMKLVWFMFTQGCGAFFFTSRFPECIWPGKFDYFFHSHQIFHCLIVVGVYLFFDVCVSAYDNRYVISSASGSAERCACRE